MSVNFLVDDDLIETMRDAISDRVAGTAMIHACYLEEACAEIERLQAENAELRERIKELISGDVMHEPNWSNCNDA